jgi:hypothetical protein
LRRWRNSPRSTRRRLSTKLSPVWRAVVLQLLPDRQQPGAIVQVRDDPVAAELAAKDFDLGFQEADAGIPAGGAGFSQEVQSDEKPSQHGLWLLNETR